MARPPKPWYWNERSAWYVTLHGKRHRLAEDRDAALIAFYTLMAQPQRPPVRYDSVVGIIDAFLDWTHKHRAPRTYDWYRDFLQSFVSTIRADLPAAALKPFHVQNWVDGKNTSLSDQRGRITAVKRAFNWAVKMGYLDASPVRGLEKPPAGRREFMITKELYESVLEIVHNPVFADLLVAAYETGARPQELICVEARHVDLVHERWVLSKDESKGKRYPRIIYLTDRVVEMTKTLMSCYPQGPLFRNGNHRPWDPCAVNCEFSRIQVHMGRKVMAEKGIDVTESQVGRFVERLKMTKRVGREVFEKTPAELRTEARGKLRAREARKHAPKLCLYLFRHSFGTRLLESGVDPLTVALLLGHRDPSMLTKVYQHLTHNPDHLRNQLKRA